MKNLHKGLNCRFELVEERMSKLEDNLLEIMQYEEQKKNGAEK